MKRTKRAPRGHGPGKGSVFVSTTIPEDVDAELRRLAALSKVTRAAMARECIEEGVQRQLVISKSRQPAKVIAYPLEHLENPTARAADDVGA